MQLSPKQFTKIFTRLSSTQSSQCLPVIKLPTYVKQLTKRAKVKEVNQQLSLKRRIAYRGNTSIAVISSTDKELNHYLGQLYKENYPIPLQSKWWFKTNSSGQKFTINPWDSNPSLPVLQNEAHVPDLFPSQFSELISDMNIINQLKECGIEYPTGIQVLTIPEIMAQKHVIVASETGSGKTVAYLAPIIQHIITLKRKRIKTHRIDAPLALVLVPGRELAEQIGHVACNLSKNSKIDVKVLVSEGALNKQLTLYPNSHIDLLVASVGTLKVLFKRGCLKLSSLEYLVLDEADTLLDDSFAMETEYILRHISVKSPHYDINTGTKLVLSSSVYPSNLDAILCEEIAQEDFTIIKSPYLHRVMPHVAQKFWRVNNESRAGELLYLVKEDYNKKIPVVIFCNKSPTCDWMSQYLLDNGVPNVKFHGTVSPVRRSKNFQDFQNGIFNVLCCTDLASRGLDTQRVKHVINFDFPNNVSDYILRAGRVGRVGSNHGHVTNFVVSAPGAVAVQKIESAVRKLSRIPEVDSNIRKKIKKLFFSP